LGSALGGMGRFWLSGWVARRIGEVFPWGTLVVNVSGSFVIGVLAVLLGPDSRWLASPRWGQFLMLGVCGGYTTFSSFSLQTLNLLHEGEWLYAAGNAGLSVTLCLLAVGAGYALGQAWNR
jgi:CrcB protein